METSIFLTGQDIYAIYMWLHAALAQLREKNIYIIPPPEYIFSAKSGICRILIED